MHICLFASLSGLSIIASHIQIQRNGDMSPLEIIRMADSSTTAVLNWQCTELMRKRIGSKRGTHHKTMFFSRAYYQLTQCIIEEAQNLITPVTVSGLL